MRMVGIIGGLSWESSAEYYRILNEEVARRRGGLSSARLVLCSVDFSWFTARMEAGAWDEIGAALEAEARSLAAAGAQAILVATNTMHRFAAEIEAAAGLPLIHIADAAGAAARGAGARRVGLMGTAYTMEQAFYRDRLRERHGVEAIIPGPEARAAVNRIIFDELCRGVVRPESKAALRGVASSLAAAGAEGIVLGCTELPLAMADGELEIPYWDTTRLHALAAVDFMLG